MNREIPGSTEAVLFARIQAAAEAMSFDEARRPCGHLPGTTERQIKMAARYRHGLAIWNPMDFRLPVEDRPHYVRSDEPEEFDGDDDE